MMDATRCCSGGCPTCGRPWVGVPVTPYVPWYPPQPVYPYYVPTTLPAWPWWMPGTTTVTNVC